MRATRGGGRSSREIRKMLIALAELLNWFRPATVTGLDYIRDRDDTLAALNIIDRP